MGVFEWSILIGSVSYQNHVIFKFNQYVISSFKHCHVFVSSNFMPVSIFSLSKRPFLKIIFTGQVPLKTKDFYNQTKSKLYIFKATTKLYWC